EPSVIPLMNCWVKTSMSGAPIEALPDKERESTSAEERLSGGRKASNGGADVRGRLWAAPGATAGLAREPMFRCRVVRPRRMETKMGRYVLLWLLGVPIPILVLIWAFGGLH